MRDSIDDHGVTCRRQPALRLLQRLEQVAHRAEMSRDMGADIWTRKWGSRRAGAGRWWLARWRASGWRHPAVERDRGLECGGGGSVQGAAHHRCRSGLGAEDADQPPGGGIRCCRNPGGALPRPRAAGPGRCFPLSSTLEELE